MSCPVVSCRVVLQEAAFEVQSEGHTAVYSALLNETGNLVAAIADMDGFKAITPEFVYRYSRGPARSLRARALRVYACAAEHV
jgi:hypothetical protein